MDRQDPPANQPLCHIDFEGSVEHNGQDFLVLTSTIPPPLHNTQSHADTHASSTLHVTHTCIHRCAFNYLVSSLPLLLIRLQKLHLVPVFQIFSPNREHAWLGRSGPLCPPFWFTLSQHISHVLEWQVWDPLSLSTQNNLRCKN